MKNNAPLVIRVIMAWAAYVCSMSIAIAQEAPSLQQQLQTIQQQPAPDTQARTPARPRANPLGVTVPAESYPPTTAAAPTTTATASITTSTPGTTGPSPSAAARSSVGPITPTAPLQPAAGAVPSVEENLRDDAFARMTTANLPLSPTQIELLRNLYDATQRAAAIYPGTPPRPTVASVAVDLSPGATPPIVRLNAGMVTSMVFVDSTGAPWPIDSFSLGNPSAYNIQWDKRSNILLVQAITAYRTGNLAVILKGLNTPVMVDFIPGQAAADTRVDLRIPGLGPQAKPTYTGLPSTEDPYLLNLLDGIPPPEAKALHSSGCDNCVWLLNGKLYLRTQYTILSPGWISTMMSADGTHVYVMQPTPMILASYNGKTIQMAIEGY